MPARRFVALARLMGTVPALRTSVRWLVRPSYVVAVTDLTRPLPPVPADVAVRLVPARADELGEALAIDPRLTEAAIHRRRATGEECGLAWHQGVATHCVWWTDHPVYLPYLGRRFRPLPGDRFCVDVASRPEWRRRGIDTAASIGYLHTSRDLGYRRAISLVASWNTPALHVALRRMHGEAAGTIGSWNLGLARRYVVTRKGVRGSRRRHLRRAAVTATSVLVTAARARAHPLTRDLDVTPDVTDGGHHRPPRG